MAKRSIALVLLAGCSSVTKADKVECGFTGITEAQCRYQGCIWQASQGSDPWCFKPELLEPKLESRSSGVSAGSSWGPGTGTIAFLFEWGWKDVAKECEDFLGPKGFTGVEISPPQEHKVGAAWWVLYQPVSYELKSRLGDEDDFRDMVQRCNAVGVQIIVDAVINHMAGGNGNGFQGSKFGNRAYPASNYTQEDFHHDASDPYHNCGIDNYNDVRNVQTCDLVGLPDLCTGCKHTQQIIAGYLKHVLSMGNNVGIRVDAAKHMDAKALGEVLALAGNPWNFQEVISAAREPVTPDMYLGNGHVTEFNFARKVAAIFKNHGKLKYLRSFGESWGLMPSAKAITFIDNHDTQRGEAELTYKNGRVYYLANVFMLATPYGLPVIMSGYSFDHFNQAPPPLPVKCGRGWVCEHRKTEVANMAAWRKSAGDSPQVLFQEGPGGNAIAFSRGDAAFVALNRDPHRTWSATLETSLRAGEYCDVAQSDDVETCPTVVVDGSGKVQINVSRLQAVAIHIGKTRGRKVVRPSNEDFEKRNTIPRSVQYDPNGKLQPSTDNDAALDPSPVMV